MPRATADDVEHDFLGDRGPELRFFESVHRLFAIPTVRRVLVANAVLGTALIPLFTFLFFFLAARWGMGPGARGLFYAVLSGFAIAGVALFGSRAERLFRASPPQLVRLAAAALGLGVVSLALGAFSPFFFGVVVLFGVAAGLLSVVTPALNAVLLSVVPVRLRPHASALAGVFFSAVGGLGGLVLLSGLDRRYGTAGAMAAVAIPGLISAWVLSGAAGSVERDLERLVEEAVDEKDATVAHAGSAHLPLVVCRRLDFSYADHQVLFGVDFRVEEGEAVAVVGTNGAGKSTLLRVMAGLELPQSGSVRVEGQDVTYLGVERRLALGIVTIVGTRSLFPSLSVVENLRLFAYTTSASSRSCRAAADRALEALPALTSARDKPAATLSGGQQRLLALARAFVLSPRLLLVDELASGLAPVALADVLGALGQLRASGTSMVVVEQSLAVAAAIADRACFLDGGRIRFDGKPADLLARHDLIRPLFLPPATRDPRLPPAPQRR